MRKGTHALANAVWRVADLKDPNRSESVEHALLAVLMDIREELRAISGRLDYPETLSIPGLLRTIVMHTKPKRKRRKKVVKS